MKISAFIYCENDENTIIDSINSLKGKVDYIVVVDNKSSDLSLEKIRSLLSREIIVIQNQFQANQTECFISAYEKLYSSTDFIVVGGGDIIYNNNYIDKLKEYMVGIEDKVGIMYSDYIDDKLDRIIYLDSFKRGSGVDNIASIVVSTHAIKIVGITTTFDQIINNITSKFVGIHIPEPLCLRKAEKI